MGARPVTPGSQTPKASACWLSVAAALLISASSARPARAERAVGLEAEGVDPMAALHNEQGLDVRDALGRPVSAAVIVRQLKAASIARIVQAAATSSLPKARLFAVVLEFALAAEAALRLPHGFEPAPESWALPVKPRSEPPAPEGAFIALVAAGCTAFLLRRLAAVPSSRSCQQSAVLRC